MSKPPTCPCCGQIVPPRFDKPLSRIQWRIFNAVKQQPLTADRLRRIVWQDDPEGGPLYQGTIYAHIYAMNKRLREYGVKIKQAQRFGEYYLVPL